MPDGIHRAFFFLIIFVIKLSLAWHSKGSLLVREMIQVLGQKHKVVVLIDEYDAPIIHYLGKDLSKAEDNRELLLHRRIVRYLQIIRRNHLHPGLNSFHNFNFPAIVQPSGHIVPLC